MSLFRDHGWTVPALVLMTWGVYAQVLDYEFVNYDDGVYSSQNRHVVEGVTRDSLSWAFSSASCEPTANWFPMTWISLMWDAGVYGTDAGGFHRTNLLLHSLNVLLVFFALRKLTGDGAKSAFVAALFAVHPLNVETVAWVSERKGLLSTCFGLMSLWAYACYARRLRARWLLLALGAYVLSLMSKQMLVTLPLLLLLLDYWPLQRLASGETQPAPESLPDAQQAEVVPSMRAVGWKRLIGEKAVFAAIAVVFCLIALEAQQRGDAIKSLERLPVSLRVGNAVVAYGLYVKRVFWPVGLSVHYPHPGDSISPVSVLLASCLLCLVTIIATRQRRQQPFVYVGWLWFLLTLLPVIGLVQIGAQQMADRYAYLPTLGLFVAVTWLVPALLPEGIWKRGVLRLGAGLALTGLALTSWIQASHWANSFTLFEQALAVTENNSVAHTNLGDAFLKQGRNDEAIEQFQAAIAADPELSLAHNNLGVARLGRGEYREAMEDFQEALRIHPHFAEPRVNLGIAHCLNGDQPKGVQLFQDVLREHPDHLRAHVCLAWVLPKLGQSEEAQKHSDYVRDHDGGAAMFPTTFDTGATP